MDEMTRLASHQPTEDTNSFSQYLSFRFYKENLDHLRDLTKDSINNFLKTVSEIEDEFLTTLKSQRVHLEDLGFTNEANIYMEENY
jgi:hypothetical protein